jgi:general secretion pathway protein N
MLTLAAAACFLPALVIQAPASLLIPPLSAATANRLQLTELQGTVWHGAARLVCRLGDGNADCGHFAWRLDARQAWRGMLALDVTGTGGGEAARIALSPHGWTVQRVGLTLPAALIGSTNEKLAALGLGGLLRLEGQDVTSRSGSLQVIWRPASTGLVPGALLGEHRLDIAAAADGKTLTVSSQKGPLNLSGGGRLQNDGQLQLDITVQAPAGDTRFSPLLSLLGKETGPNTFRLRLPTP